MSDRSSPDPEGVAKPLLDLALDLDRQGVDNDQAIRSLLSVPGCNRSSLLSAAAMCDAWGGDRLGAQSLLKDAAAVAES